MRNLISRFLSWGFGRGWGPPYLQYCQNCGASRITFPEKPVPDVPAKYTLATDEYHEPVDYYDKVHKTDPNFCRKSFLNPKPDLMAPGVFKHVYMRPNPHRFSEAYSYISVEHHVSRPRHRSCGCPVCKADPKV